MKQTSLIFLILSAGSIFVMAGPEAIRDDKKAVVTSEQRDLCNWTGFYIGGSVGYAFEGNADVTLDLTGDWELFTEPSDESFAEPLGSRDLHASGIQAGAFLGYNHHWNQFVIGLEGQFNYVDLEGSFDSGLLSVSPGSGDPIRVRQSYETHYLATVGPRLGYAWDKILFYVTGGLAIGQLKFSQEITEPGFGFIQTGSTDDAQLGWTAGGGIQYCVNEHWSVRAEYRYVDLGSADFSSVGNDPFFTGHHEACLTLHSATVGLAYKF